MHSLGVMSTMLLGLESLREEREHTVRFGFAPGIDPRYHAAFEARFLDTRKVFSVQRKPQILLEIVSAYVVVAQPSMHQFSVVN